MKVAFSGLGEQVATFTAPSTVKKRMLVFINMSGNVNPCAADAVFCGVALSVRDGTVAVQLGGYVRMPYTGNAPTVGYCSLAASSNTEVKRVTEGGREYLVLDVNTTDKTVGFLLK